MTARNVDTSGPISAQVFIALLLRMHAIQYAQLLHNISYHVADACTRSCRALDSTEPYLDLARTQVIAQCYMTYIRVVQFKDHPACQISQQEVCNLCLF